MKILGFTYWQDGDAWLGYWDEFPDYWSQAVSFDGLKEHLRDLLSDLHSGEIPCIRHHAKMEVV